MKRDEPKAPLSIADSFGFRIPGVPCHDLASERLKQIAGLAVHQPRSLKASDIREIGVSVLALIERHAQENPGASPGGEISLGELAT